MKNNMKNQESLSKVNINWYPGHMAKTKKQMQEDLKLVDVVVEILDARIPKSSQNPDIAKMIEGKKRVVVLNKSDLAEENENRRWQEYFKSNGIPAIIVDSNIGNGVKEVTSMLQHIMKDELIRQQKKGRVQKNIRIMIVGIPNVGKSSFINRISKRNAAIVGNKPGVTRQKQWVRIENNIELLDTPGVLWPKFGNQKVALNLAFTGTIKSEIMDEYEVAYYLISFLYKNYKNKLMQRYSISDNEIDLIFQDDEIQSTVSLIETIAKKRGAIMSKGRIDETKVSRLILDDFRNGKFGRITLEKVGDK